LSHNIKSEHASPVHNSAYIITVIIIAIIIIIIIIIIASVAVFDPRAVESAFELVTLFIGTPVYWQQKLITPW